MRISSGLGTVFAGMLMAVFLNGTATAEETYFLLKSKDFVQQDLNRTGPCLPKASLPLNSHGKMEFKAWEDNPGCGNSVTLTYSFTPPPKVIRSGQNVRFEHSIQSSGKQGPDNYQGSGSIHGGCIHATSQLIEPVTVNGGGAHMQDNGPKSDHKSGSPVLFTGNGCNDGQQYVIAVSMAKAGTHYYTYDVMKGTPPPITEPDKSATPPKPPVTTGQTGQTTPPKTTGQTEVQPDGTITDGKAIWQPEGPQRSAKLTTLGSVQNGPTRPSVFRVPEPMLLVSIMTYHWNNGRGAALGSIAVQHETGIVLGPWQASGSDGQGGVANAYWHVKPGIILQPGRYTVIDSNPETWATSSDVDGRGIFEAKLQKVTQIGSILPTPDDGTNLDGKPSGPKQATGITVTPPEKKQVPRVIVPTKPTTKTGATSGKSGKQSGSFTPPAAPPADNSSGTQATGAPPPDGAPTTVGQDMSVMLGYRGGAIAAAIDTNEPGPDLYGAWIVRRAIDNVTWQLFVYAGPGQSKSLMKNPNGYYLATPLHPRNTTPSGSDRWAQTVEIRDNFGQGADVEFKFSSQNNAEAIWRWTFGGRSHELFERTACDLQYTSDDLPPVDGCHWQRILGPMAEQAYLDGLCRFGDACHILIPHELRY